MPRRKKSSGHGRPPGPYKNVGARFRTIRTFHKKTAAEVCRLLGITQAHYSNVEHGHVMPGRELLQAFADLFETSIDYLLDRHRIISPEMARWIWYVAADLSENEKKRLIMVTPDLLKSLLEHLEV